MPQSLTHKLVVPSIVGSRFKEQRLGVQLRSQVDDRKQMEQEEVVEDAVQLDEEQDIDKSFEGQVTINNWGMTRRQRIIQNISFETQEHDIYNPDFSIDSFEFNPASAIGKLTTQTFGSEEFQSGSDDLNESRKEEKSKIKAVNETAPRRKASENDGCTLNSDNCSDHTPN